MSDWTRREFLNAVLATTGTLAAGDALALFHLAAAGDPLAPYPYRGWETLYRDQYTWDSIGRTTHGINCTGSCTWKGYVKDGVLFKEEQYADFPAINDQVPSYNPRGCQKGANCKEYVYGPQRLKYPLIRVGERGEGKWRRATWDEAFSLIAGQVVDAIDLHGPDTVTFFAAIPAKHHLTLAGGFRLANLIGGVVCSFYDWYCDLPPGEPITWGVQTDSCEAADWVNSRYLILWGSNLLETRVPDAHFFTEARINGTKIVSIHPEYNPTTIHADIHLPVKPGTDAKLALAMAQVIVSERRYDEPYIKRFTDLPLLVRTDTQRLLRESDLVAGGSEEQFYLWDSATQQAVLAPGTRGSSDRTLELGAIDPVLEGLYSVDALSGPVEVTPVFERLKVELARHPLGRTARVTGINHRVIRRVARELARTKPARIIGGAGTNHYYHNDLINRAQILLMALTGNVGVPGGGFDHYVGQEKLWAEEGFFNFAFPLGRPGQRFQNTTLWSYVHAEVQSDVDRLLPRPMTDYIRTSVSNGWMPLYPEGTLDNGRTPKVLFVWGANYLNQAKGNLDVLRNLYPKLDLIVDINFRMDTTALYADVVLPAASWYEQWNLSTTDLHSFIHPFTPVIPPQFESATDWQIWQGLASALAATGYSFTDTAPDGSTIMRDFTTLYRDLTTGALGENLSNDQDACQYLLDHSPETAGLTMDQLNLQPRRMLQTSEGWSSDLKPGEPYYGFQRMTEQLRPLDTLAGRQQFYIDHPWFEELGEQLPTFKFPTNVDRYPLRWITPHGRWSIHSTWRDAKFQLRLQRGRPIVYLNPDEATARGLQDNDLIEVFNGHGSFQAHLNVTPRLQPGMAQMYHGWERYFLNSGWQSPVTIRINPTQLAGGYGQLFFRLNYWGPTGSQRDTRVDIRKA